MHIFNMGMHIICLKTRRETNVTVRRRWTGNLGPRLSAKGVSPCLNLELQTQESLILLILRKKTVIVCVLLYCTIV